jgi:hypothetical protein
MQPHGPDKPKGGEERKKGGAGKNEKGKKGIKKENERKRGPFIGFTASLF